MPLTPEALHKRRLLAHQRRVVRIWGSHYIKWWTTGSRYKLPSDYEMITNTRKGLEVVMRDKAGDAVVAMTYKRFCDILLAEVAEFTESDHYRALNPNLGA